MPALQIAELNFYIINIRDSKIGCVSPVYLPISPRFLTVSPRIVSIFYHQWPNTVKETHDISLKVVNINIRRSVVVDLHQLSLSSVLFPQVRPTSFFPWPI